jgi:hypothetical protein
MLTKNSNKFGTKKIPTRDFYLENQTHEKELEMQKT